MQNESNAIFYLPLRIVLLIYSVFVGYYLPSWEGMSSCWFVWAIKLKVSTILISKYPPFCQNCRKLSKVTVDFTDKFENAKKLLNRVSSVKIWDFLQQYPTFGDNGNIYTDYLTNWGSIILLVHFITGRSPRSVDHGPKLVWLDAVIP